MAKTLHLKTPHLLIVEARFHEKFSDALLEGAKSALEEADATYEIVTVPGALEIPVAVAMAIDVMMRDALDLGDMDGMASADFDGFVALGLVMHDEAEPFENVATIATNALVQLSVAESLALGHGIVTAQTEEQAWERVSKDKLDKGGFAARAALSMIALKSDLAD